MKNLKWKHGKLVFVSSKHKLPNNRIRINLENPRSVLALRVLALNYFDEDCEFSESLLLALEHIHGPAPERCPDQADERDETIKWCGRCAVYYDTALSAFSEIHENHASEPMKW